ncbi:MAG: EAL domain-containing protein [Ilumatobacteraceae bacterium]|nr:EAL domain-containing protein [Ilumatobacteraceae bacterium]
MAAVALAVSWMVNVLAGGANHMPPHGFYVPILFAAVRFGGRGAVCSGAAAMILAGPLLPADVDAGTAQVPREWIIRGVFFVVIGLCVAGLVQAAVSRERRMLDRARVQSEIAAALAARQFRLRYQPIVSLDGTDVVGVEALIRWEHPTRGLLAPGAFIEFAEETGQIIDIGRWVLTEACRQVASWRGELLDGVDDFGVAVNISARELNEPSLVDAIRDVLTSTGLPPHWLHLEVTETAIITDLDTSERHLRAIKALGVKLAVDDFGVGYGSMTYLSRFPIDIVKIDRSFVAPIAEHSEPRNVAGGIVLLARSLGMQTVAEGVETIDQANALRQLDCDHAQGWLFGHPETPTASADRLRDQRRRQTEQDVLVDQRGTPTRRRS